MRKRMNSSARGPSVRPTLPGAMRLFTTALLPVLLLTAPAGARAQTPPQAPPQVRAPAAPQLDSLRARLYTLNREQMEEVQQVLRARQSEFEAIREAMQEELERNAQRLEEARRVYEEVRQQNAQVRQQAEAVLQEALRERQRIVREQLGQGFPAPMLGDPGFPFTTGGAQMYFRADSAVRVLRGDSVTYLRDDVPWAMVPEILDRFNQQNSLRPPVTVGIPAVTGQRFVAGVELTNLNPSLARYFGVEAGVLVTAVTDRSPGDAAGILAGDVIVEVGGEAVTTVQEVRQAMNRRSATRILEPGRFDLELRSPAPITLRVIREGQTLDLEIPR